MVLLQRCACVALPAIDGVHGGRLPLPELGKLPGLPDSQLRLGVCPLGGLLRIGARVRAVSQRQLRAVVDRGERRHVGYAERDIKHFPAIDRQTVVARQRVFDGLRSGLIVADRVKIPPAPVGS